MLHREWSDVAVDHKVQQENSSFCSIAFITVLRTFCITFGQLLSTNGSLRKSSEVCDSRPTISGEGS